MIFCFTGTGNSLFAAKRLQEGDEKIISIAEAIKKEEYEYEIEEGENVGIVFPVYFYTVPTIVEEFLEKVEIKNAEYIYAVITCGGGISQAGVVLKKQMEKRGYILRNVKPLLMPDNAMLYYQIPTAKEGEERLKKAERKLEEIKGEIKRREQKKIGRSAVVSKIAGKAYRLAGKTKKFYADEKCVGCGKCEKICPEGVIKIKEGKPVWIKKECTKCSACINRCPKLAIQYGKRTAKRNRYVNPEIK